MTRQRIAIALSVAVILAATLTSGGRDDGARWSVACLTCSETWLADAISNVALFVPLAASLAWRSAVASHEGVPRRSQRGLRTAGGAVLLCTLLSFSIESAQFVGVPSGRTPSLHDWICNSAGAVMGASAARWWAGIAWPSAARARVLATAWTILAMMGLTASSVALSPSVPSVGATSAVSASRLPYTPGYGWYAAFPDSAFVNGVPVPHGGNGPVIVEMERTDTVRATVRVQGRDSRPGAVPIVYVHRLGDRDVLAADAVARVPKPRGFAHLLLAQRGRDAIVQAALLANRYGLAAPLLVARDAYVPTADSSKADGTWRWLTATASDREWTLATRSANHNNTQELTLSPAIGWGLIQTVVGLDARVAPVLCVMWLLGWFAPLGYWMVFATVTMPLDARGPTGTRRMAIAAALSGGALLAALWWVATWVESPRLTPVESVICGVGALLGAAAARSVCVGRNPRRANAADAS